MHRLLQRRDTPLRDPSRPRGLAVLAITLGVVYLGWRATTLGSGWLLALSVPLYLAEWWALVQLALFAFQAWRVPEQTAVGTHDAPAEVDIVVTCAVEDQHEVERSLVGVGVLQHRGRVTVVDATERQAIRAVAHRHGADYVIDPDIADGAAAAVHAEAGTDLYLWLEAGQVPMPELVTATLERFTEPDVAVCQVAVGLLNSDSLVHVRHGRDEDALLRDVTGPGLDRLDAAPWFGAASVVRRAAIEGIGGFAPRDPAAVERALIDLHRDGWVSRYETRRLIREVAPDTLDAYLRRRRRQAIQALRVFRTPENPLRLRGLGLAHRVVHLAAASPFTTGLRQLAMVLILTATLLAGHIPADASVGRILLFWSATGLVGALARRALGRGTLGFGDWTRHAWRTLGADIGALLEVAGHDRGEHASPTSRRDTGLRALGRLRLLTASVLVLEAALMIRAATIVDADLLAPFQTGERVVVLGLGILVLLPMVDVLQVVVFRRQRRRHFRLHTELAVELGSHHATTVDLAPTGVGLLMEFAPAVGALSPIRLDLPALDGTIRSVRGSAIVRDANPHESGLVRVGLEFVNLADPARAALIEYCMIGHDAHRQSVHSELPVAHAHLLHIGREDHHNRLLQGATGLAVFAGVITLFLGPSALVAQATEREPADHACVLTSSGDPVPGAIIEQHVRGQWTTVGATGTDGCTAVAGVPTASDLAATWQGVRRAGAAVPNGDGRATFVLEHHVVRVFDTSGHGVADARVRHFADAWHEAGMTDSMGVRSIEVLATDVTIDISWRGGRFALPMGAGGTDVVLARIEAGDAAVSAVDRGAGFERFVDGMELLPGRVTLRLANDDVVRAELPAGHLYTVSTGRLTDLRVPVPPPAAPTSTVTPEPTATAEQTPTATDASTPSASPAVSPASTPAASPTVSSAPAPSAEPTASPTSPPEPTPPLPEEPAPTQAPPSPTSAVPTPTTSPGEPTRVPATPAAATTPTATPPEVTP